MLEIPGQLQRGRSPSASRTRSAFGEDCTIFMASFPLPSKLQESVIISTESDVVVDRSRGVERLTLVVVRVSSLDRSAATMKCNQIAKPCQENRILQLTHQSEEEGDEAEQTLPEPVEEVAARWKPG